MTTSDTPIASPQDAPWSHCGPAVARALHRALIEGKGRRLDAPTPIQSRSLQHFSAGDKPTTHDYAATLLKAPTGTGKTLAYVLPMLQDLMLRGPLPRDSSPLAVVVAPTRDLATQIFRDVLDPVVSALKPHWLTCGLLVGGNDRAQEKLRLRKGLHIIVCTPGRLLDHLAASTHCQAERWQRHCRWIVVDEVDRLVDGGFAPKVRQFLSIFKEAASSAQRRELVVVSATGLTESGEVDKRQHVLDVLGLSSEQHITVLSADPVSSSDNTDGSSAVAEPVVSFPPTLRQMCWVCPQTKLKLAWLFVKLRALVQQGHRRIIVFVSCRDVVDYVVPMGRKLLGPACRTIGLHAQVADRQEIVRAFDACDDDQADAKSHILFTTDVAARGVDFRAVSVVVQWEAASDRSDYVHRVGRCARQGADGTAYIMLLPHEQGYLQLLPPGCSVQIDDSAGHGGEEEAKAWDTLHRMQDAVEADDALRELAERAGRASLRAYATHGGSERQFFHPRLLHLGHQSGMFGLAYIAGADKQSKANGGKTKHIQRRLLTKKSHNQHSQKASKVVREPPANSQRRPPSQRMSEFSAF